MRHAVLAEGMLLRLLARASEKAAFHPFLAMNEEVLRWLPTPNNPR